MIISPPQVRRTSDGVAVGCCGWGDPRARYFAHFPVIELQTTFYELPSPALALKWRGAAPQRFQFCMKAWQLITHTPSSPTYRRLRSAVSRAEHNLFGSFRPTEQVWLAWQRTTEIARAVQASVILFQCPASFTPDAGNVRNFRAFFARVRSDGWRLAWEPRGDWPAGLIRDLCSEFDLLHCVDPFRNQSVYGRSVYWRLHGRSGYAYRYSDDELQWLRDHVHMSTAEGREPIYVLFNNMSMVPDALRFQASLIGTGRNQRMPRS